MDGSLRFSLFMLALLGGGALFSIICMKFKAKKVIWNLPAILGMGAIAYYSCKLTFGELEGFEGLGYFVMILMIGTIVLGNILATVIILFLQKRKSLKESKVAKIKEE